jgi:protein-S-isoprenylcysteine O-methyltransferase Ste14
MISLTVTDYIKNRFGRHFRFYRLFFNLLALTTLIPIILYGKTLKEQVLFRWEGYLIILQVFLLITSVLLFISGGRKYDLLQFLGIRQIKTGTSHTALSETGDIDTTGILSLTRHPWYLAAILVIWSSVREVYVSTLIINMILTIYIVIGTFLEERKLIIAYGDKYRSYQKKVSMFVPFKWFISKLTNS